MFDIKFEGKYNNVIMFILLTCSFLLPGHGELNCGERDTSYPWQFVNKSTTISSAPHVSEMLQ